MAQRRSVTLHRACALDCAESISRRTLYLTTLLFITVTVGIIQFWDHEALQECPTISCFSGIHVWHGYVFMAVLITVYSYDLLMQIPRRPVMHNRGVWVIIALVYMMIIMFNLVGFFPTHSKDHLSPSNIVHAAGVVVCLVVSGVIIMAWNWKCCEGIFKKSNSMGSRVLMSFITAAAFVVPYYCVNNGFVPEESRKAMNVFVIYAELVALLVLRSNVECIIRKIRLEEETHRRRGSLPFKRTITPSTPQEPQVLEEGEGEVQERMQTV
uniref:Uncharacterized protein n=1 Tax=Chromera velia CCMP2878 TaxID=1169474 RepID=A0A0G4HBS0_9ALVE|eukprot:Cvel_26016.t1-p1 / transcript=Cvel_26016.t1 / gene=Cvel_26016 / organism=Chromera_velia_CCMP2878 / gene_product=hypothetical protein / transcript_product=hypothetical protein / location=Cvel_scaffold3028:8168-8971(+) / protein_length=268 / sequence_SO=supercontig / SO=protein_coding / is_pseudo=false